MKIVISLAAAAALSAAAAVAFAADTPDWAYPETPKPHQQDNTEMKSVPGSSKQYTQAQIDDGFNPPDWFPDEHPPMPQIVAHGGAKPAVRACALCHLPSGEDFLIDHHAGHGSRRASQPRVQSFSSAPRQPAAALPDGCGG